MISTGALIAAKKQERKLFLRTYRVPVIEQLFKRRFFALFGNACFHCGLAVSPTLFERYPSDLCMDHHVPWIAGGRLVAGNIVSLCRLCNSAKGEKLPEAFYGRDQLNRLQPLLDAQSDVLAFAFDWGAWRADRAGYLLSLGVHPDVVEASMRDELFWGYVGEPSQDRAIDVSFAPFMTD